MNYGRPSVAELAKRDGMRAELVRKWTSWWEKHKPADRFRDRAAQPEGRTTPPTEPDEPN